MLLVPAACGRGYTIVKNSCEVWKFDEGHLATIAFVDCSYLC